MSVMPPSDQDRLGWLIAVYMRLLIDVEFNRVIW